MFHGNDAAGVTALTRHGQLLEQSLECSIDEVAFDLRLSVNDWISLPGEAQRSAYETHRGPDDLVESCSRQAHRCREIDLPAGRGDWQGKDCRQSRTRIGHGPGVVQGADGWCSETRCGLRLKARTKFVTATRVAPRLQSGVDHVLDLGRACGLGQHRVISKKFCEPSIAAPEPDVEKFDGQAKRPVLRLLAFFLPDIDVQVASSAHVQRGEAVTSLEPRPVVLRRRALDEEGQVEVALVAGAASRVRTMHQNSRHTRLPSAARANHTVGKSRLKVRDGRSHGFSLPASP